MSQNQNSTNPATNKYYFLNNTSDIPTMRPSLSDDVIRMYGLQDLAQSLTRQNPDGSKGVKLRKSYKSHISDLPGKHVVPIDDSKTFSRIVLMPDNPDFIKPKIDPFPIEYLQKVIKFEKTGPNGIPGFDSNKLALSNMNSSDLKKEKKRKAGVNNVGGTPELQPDAKRRHVQVKFN